jgi:general secretion pathway protein N
MKRRTLAALAILAPASFGLSLIGADIIGISATDISGSIWNGRLKGSQYRGIPLGDLEVSLDPFALLSGSRHLTVQGPLGRARLVQADLRGFEGTNVVIEIQHFKPSIRIAGRLMLENATLLFSGTRCARAEGSVATDVLERAFRGPEVVGNLSCAGDAAVAQLQGRTQDVDVSIALRLDADGRYQAETRVISADPVVRGALALAGFAENGEGFTRLDEGALGI